MKRIWIFLIVMQSIVHIAPLFAYNSMRVGLSYSWKFARDIETNGRFWGAVPSNFNLNYEFGIFKYFVLGGTAAYGLNNAALTNSSGQRFNADINYFILGARIGLIYSLFNLFTIQGGVLPYAVWGIGTDRPSNYDKSDWPGQVLKAEYSPYINLMFTPFWYHAKMNNMGIYVEYAPNLAISFGFAARTQFDGQENNYNGDFEDRLSRHEEMTYALSNCDFQKYTELLKNDREFIQTLLLEGIGITGYALHHAVFRKCHEIARHMLENGADVHARNPSQKTPLFYAVEEDDLEMVKILTDAGAQVYIEDKEGKSPYKVAKDYKRKEILKYFNEQR